MRKLAMWLLGLALVTAALPSIGSASEFSITALGGTIIPTGSFGDQNHLGAKVGYQFGGSVDYELMKGFAIGVDGSYNNNKNQLEGTVVDFGGGDNDKINKARFTTIQAGVHGKYLIPVQGPVRPYALLGLGAYQTNYKEEGDSTFSGLTGPYTLEIKSGTHFGGKLGVGAAWSIQDMWALGAELNYNLISLDKKKNFQLSSLQYVGITAGLTWKAPMGAKSK